MVRERLGFGQPHDSTAVCDLQHARARDGCCRGSPAASPRVRPHSPSAPPARRLRTMPNGNGPGLDGSAFPVERSRCRGRARARVRAPGSGRLSASARPRLAGDQADLVAQHRAARPGRLRGDRPGPSRLRGLRPRSRRLLRPGFAGDRSVRAGSRRARPRAVRDRGRRSRRGRDPGPRAAIRRLRRAPMPLQHDPAAPSGRIRARPGIPPRISRETRGRGRLLPAPGARGGRPGRRAGHRRAPAPLHRAVLRIPLLGHAGQPSTGTTSTS